MADNSNNILTRLQQHSIEPPAGTFEKAWQAIVQNEDAVEKHDADVRKVFARLQDHTLTAPPLNFDSLKITAIKKRAVVVSAFWLRAAAAIILVLITASIFYYTVFRKKDTISNNYAGPGVIKDTAAIAKNNAGDTAIKEITGGKANVPAIITTSGIEVRLKKNIIRNSYTGSSKQNGTVEFSNTESQLYENDVLLTLVNYKSRNWEQFFTKAVAEKKITLNKYSYQDLSDKMVALLQDMYLTKDNGKPSRKAKKIKRKFEKWRKKDEKYFDKDLQKNPADIIDLSEFILKNN